MAVRIAIIAISVYLLALLGWCVWEDTDDWETHHRILMMTYVLAHVPLFAVMAWALWRTDHDR